MKEYFIEYKGRMIRIKPVMYEGKLNYYELDKCPICGLGSTLHPSIHKVEENNGKLTINPSLVCPHNCTWHVWVKDGIAIDC